MWRPSSAKTGKQLPRSGQTTSSSFSENSEALGRRKGPRSNNLGPLLYIPRRARTINSAGLPSNGRRGESSDHRQFLFASPPSSRTDRASYHNKLLTVTRQDGEGLVWGLSPLVLHVERPSREDQGPYNIRLRSATATVLLNELIGVRVSTE